MFFIGNSTSAQEFYSNIIKEKDELKVEHKTKQKHSLVENQTSVVKCCR